MTDTRQIIQSYRWLALAAVLATYLLIVVGGLVRTTGSGLGCPDWPLCEGQVVPRLEGTTLIEFSHRVVSTVASLLMVAVAFFGWRNFGGQKWIVRPAVLTVALLVFQIVLGGVTVLLELPPVIVAAHLGNAMIILALLILVTLYAFRPIDPLTGGRQTREALPRLAYASMIGTYILLVSGTIVLGTSAHYACTTWPLCSDSLIPTAALPLIAALHRYIAAAIGVLILYTFVRVWRTQRENSSLMSVAIVAAVLFVLQIIVGALGPLLGFPIVTQLTHLATATAVWASMVAFAVVAGQTVTGP